MGHFAVSIAMLRRAVVLDPLDLADHTSLGNSLYLARRYRQAVAAYAEAISVGPGFKSIYGGRGFAFLALGDLSRARTSCETNRDYWVNQWCLAIVYDKLGRRSDADAEVAKLKAAEGDAAAYQYATIYAQRGDRTQALQWLDTTMRLRDPGLLELKTDPLLDPLRAEPHFQADLRKLNFPAD
jgi:tetratricopeptide (TPR) repeat protein